MLRVYNTLSGQKEEFQPVEKGRVKMYVCGLTVQNYSHLGHIRSAINYDVIRRYLEYKGFKVTYIMNFTDVNEKIVARAKEEGLKPMELAEKYAGAYLEDIEQLNIKPATEYVKATENIDQIVRMVETLIEKGYAYEADGNVYYSVDRFADYGKLSGRSLDEMEAGARIEVLEDKKNPMDFALWKKVDDDEEIYWDSPWGRGWPGWHIECSAMSMEYLGSSFDIHGGGTDLIFPHHENEIAQSEACSGVKPFAKYWIHNGTVNLKGEKMSKSLGNFFTTRELLKKFNADEIRYFLLTKHYHSPIDFSLEEINQARVSLNKLLNTVKNMERILELKEYTLPKKLFTHEDFVDRLKSRREQFEEAMDDDFNSARAIGVLHELAKDINSFINSPEFSLNETTQLLVKEGYDLFHKLAEIMGLKLESTSLIHDEGEVVDDLMDFILKIREAAREEKNWAIADRIRDGLQDLGFDIKDTPQGPGWERIRGKE